MTSGKPQFNIFLFFIVLSSSYTSNLSPSVLRGGLVYSEESSLGPVYLNRDYVSFIRAVDTSILERAAQTTRDYTTLYHTLCRSINNYVTPFDVTPKKQKEKEPDEITFSPVKYLIKEGKQVCKNMGAKLPEIRDEPSRNTIRFAAIRKNITKFPAGVYFDSTTKTFRYESDHTPANYHQGNSPFRKIHYGGIWTDGDYKGDWEHESAIVNQGSDWFILYNNPAHDFTIRQADANDAKFKDYIMCMKPVDATFEQVTRESNILMQLSKNACIRDEKALVASTELILAEIEAITNLNISIQSYAPKMEDFFPVIITPDQKEEITSATHKRKRRHLTKKYHLQQINTKPKKRTTKKRITKNRTTQKRTTKKRNFKKRSTYTSHLIPSQMTTNHKQLKQYLAMVNNMISHQTIKSRKRRTPMVTTANAVSSTVTGDAPLSWLGEAIGYLLGFPTKNSPEFKQIARNAKNIETLSINQKSIHQTLQYFSKRLSSFGTQLMKTLKAQATLSMEQDLKHMIQHMQGIQQMTLLKYANVLMAGQLGKTSPYAISNKELLAQRQKLREEKGIIITDKIEDTRSTIGILNNTIQILIQVPILDEQKLFNFYHVQPLPIFKDNRTFLPDVDAEYVAISKSGSYYADVNSVEFTRCVITPEHCRVSSPATPVGSTPVCTINTFINRKLMCPVVEIQAEPHPVILINGNRTIYSVPTETRLYVKCYDHIGSHRFTDETINITGMGETTFRPSCSITLPGGATFNTPAALIEEQISGSKLFEHLRTYDTPNNIIIRPAPDTYPDLPMIQLQELEHGDIWYKTFASSDTLPSVTKIIVITVIIIILLITIYYCCPCPRICCEKARRSALRQRRKRKKEEDHLKEEEHIRTTDMLLQQLASKMDQLTQSQSAPTSRWPSTPGLFTFSKAKVTSDDYEEADNLNSSNPIPPPIGAPHLSYKLKDIESGAFLNKSSPICKRVQFETTS